MKKESVNGEIEKLKQVPTAELIESVRKIHALNSSGKVWLILELCRRLEVFTKKIETKTVIDWLFQAKADGFEWADSAIAQVDGDKDKEVNSLHEAVDEFAVWDDTKEGYDFWLGVSQGSKRNAPS